MLRVLVPLDGSALAQQAIAHAVVFAQAFEIDLHLIRIVERPDVDPDSTFDSLDWELRCTQCRRYLQELKESLAHRNIASHVHVVEGKPPAEINEFCRKHSVDLVVMTAYGAGGITEFRHGGTTQKILNSSKQSLLIVRPSEELGDAPVSYQRLLVVMDGSRRSDWAVMLGATLAGETQATLELLQIVHEPKVTPGVAASAEGKDAIDRLVELCRQDAQGHVAQARAHLPPDLPVQTRIHVAQDVPQLLEELVRHDNVDLLVLSAHGISATGLEPHSLVTKNVVAQISCPVLILQDAQLRSFQLKPRSGEPMRSDNRPQSQSHRAEAS